jgi:CheY-like chemotaxis protein
LQLGESVPERVLTDPTRLRQILVNLVGNAVKFTDRGTVSLRLRVEASAGGPRLVFEVDDTGRGLARAEAVRLFSLFTQADGTMTRRFGGTGLGLAISRRLARLMGGDVNLVRAAPDEGCCFQVDLPLEVDSDCRTMASLEVEEMERIRGPLPSTKIVNGRILLAEDNAINRRLVVLHLERAGAQVDTAANGAIALECIEKARAAGTPYDLLLTDMQMPELDGYALARILRDLGSNIPIIALTAHSMAEDRERCLEAGCDDYATKPIDAPSLLAQCARWMSREAIREETDLDARAADPRTGRS